MVGRSNLKLDISLAPGWSFVRGGLDKESRGLVECPLFSYVNTKHDPNPGLCAGGWLYTNDAWFEPGNAPFPLGVMRRQR